MFFSTSFAEEASEISQVLETVTKEEALGVGTVLGIGLGVLITLGIIYFVLRAIADWKIFTKAGRAGWKSLVPFLCEYEEFDICWKGSYGMICAILLAAGQWVDTATRQSGKVTWVSAVLMVVGIVILVLSFRESIKLAKAFGKGKGFGIGLFLLGPIFKLILGFGSARYVGKPD